MRSIGHWLLGLAASLASFASPALAQDTGVIVYENRPAGALTDAQWQSLYGPKEPRPGIYRLKPLHSGRCLSVNNAAGPTEKEYIEQILCRDNSNELERFIVIPHPLGGFTIRSQAIIFKDRRAANPDQVVYCATVARGVLFGPARIDVHACDLPAGAGDWVRAGLDDQRFNIVPVGPSNYELRPVGASNECWAIRGASRDSFVDVIKWSCNGGGDQHFNFEWVAPIASSVEGAVLNRAGWYWTPDGHRRLEKTNGVELTGPSSSYFETIADNGDYCMKRCSELTECKGWTWSAAGFGGQSKPMCHWKTTLGKPVNHGPAAFGKVMSGIIRP